MAFDSELIFDIVNLRFIRSVEQPSFINPPEWVADDIKHLKLQFVRPSGNSSVEIVSGAGLSVTLAVGAPAGSPTVDTSATSGSADASDIFTIDLPLNVAAVQTALGSSSSVTRTLEFRVTDGVNPQRYQTQVVIKQRLITGTLADPAAPAVAMSTAEAMSILVPRDGSNSTYPCSYFLMIDEDDSTKVYKVGIKAGQMHVENLA